MSLFKPFKSDFYKEKSVLTAKDIVEWKRKNNLYNFDTLPKVAIISAVYELSLPKRLLYKKLKGLNGKNFIVNKKVLFCAGFGAGSPAIIALLEELVALGVAKFLYIGFAGRLNANLIEGDSYIVSNAFSICGTSFFYNNNSFISYPNSLSDKIKRELGLSEKIVLSTDAPYKETSSILDFYKKENAALIDMETASILAFFNQNKKEVACILIASDLLDFNWMPPKNIDLTRKVAKNIVNQFIASL